MTENTPAVIQVLNPTEEVTDKIIVTLDGEDKVVDTQSIGLTFESSESEIMGALSPMIQEEFGKDISEYYKVQKSTNSRNIHIIPNSVAG
jgi:hypothetical protein